MTRFPSTKRRVGGKTTSTSHGFRDVYRPVRMVLLWENTPYVDWLAVQNRCHTERGLGAGIDDAQPAPRWDGHCTAHIETLWSRC